MSTSVLKVEIESEACTICGVAGELLSPEEYDAGTPHLQVPLRTILLQLNNNKVVPEGRLCTDCIRRAKEAYEFSSALSTKGAPPLSEKIRALRRKLHELTQKIDVFIVVGGPGINSGGTYSEDDIIMVEKEALAAAAAADDEDLERARNACGETVYQCTVCPLSFQRASEYRAHAVQHGAGARHSCWTCGAQFASRAALAEHAARHADDAPLCRLCNMRLADASEFRRHEAACVARCPACGDTYPSRAALAAHARAAHAAPGAPPPLVCAVCFATCATSEALSAHALRHRHADRFLCGYDACILRFSNRSELMAHIRKCHSGALSEPEQDQEPEPEPQPQPERPSSVSCETCGRSFGSAAAMKRHARVHRNVKNARQESTEWGELMQGGEEGEGVEYLEMDTLDDGDFVH